MLIVKISSYLDSFPTWVFVIPWQKCVFKNGSLKKTFAQKNIVPSLNLWSIKVDLRLLEAKIVLVVVEFLVACSLAFKWWQKQLIFGKTTPSQLQSGISWTVEYLTVLLVSVETVKSWILEKKAQRDKYCRCLWGHEVKQIGSSVWVL